MFIEDFKIETNEKGKVKKKDVEKFYKEFCKDYINQIKDKLDFEYKFIDILRIKKDDDTQLKKKSSTNLRKKIEDNEEVIGKKIRFQMRMVKPVNRISKKRKKKPKVSRPEQDPERTRKIRKEREVNK